MRNVTRCICPLSGTYVVLMERQKFNVRRHQLIEITIHYHDLIDSRPYLWESVCSLIPFIGPLLFFPSHLFQSSIIETTHRPMFVIVSCGFCFIQSCTTFAILLPILYNRKCTVTFMKMQFCTTTATAMAIFVLGFFKQLPPNWYGVINSIIAAILLLGTSTLIGIILVVQSELCSQRFLYKSSSNGSSSASSNSSLSSSLKMGLSTGLRSAIGLSWLLPILYAVGVPLVHNITKQWPRNWWQEYPGVGFVIFIVADTTIGFIFFMLFLMLVKKIMYLSRKFDKHISFIITRYVGECEEDKVVKTISSLYLN